MFERIRIWWDFLSYEAHAKMAWHQHAAESFSTDKLRLALEDQLRDLDQQTYRAYGASIAKLEARARDQTETKSNAESNAEVFRRNFKHELERAYGDLESIKSEQAVCKAELTTAFSDLEAAKSAIDSWHRKSQRSPWLFGNSSKRLPQHSLFGQSFGDLDGYKDDRGQAVDDIGRLRAHQRELSHRFDVTRSRVQAIKADRQCWFDLQRRGYTIQKLEETIGICQTHLRQLQSEIGRLVDMRDVFVQAQKAARGIDQLEREIADIESRKSNCLAQFDEPSELEKRKAAHRNQWLGNRKSQP